MIHELLNTIYAGIDVERVWGRTERIWRSDRWMTASAWRRTAEYVAAELESDGLADVEIFECAADGESEFFGHKNWPVWEVRDAKLETIGRKRQVLAHYKRNPRGLLTYSSPTPKGGIEAELVMVDDGRKRQHYRGLDVKGKIVFTRQHGGEAAGVAAKMGAVGVLSDFLVNRDSHYLHWMPALTRRELFPDPPDWDTHVQWMQVFAHEAGMFGFALSPAEGEKLRRQLRRGRIRVRAAVDAEFSKGTYPAVTAVVPGTARRGEQVMVLSHLFEQGANDNASGCAASMEVASSLNRLIKRGKLARPKRSIRVLYMLEMQGTRCYLHHHRRQISKTLAALCLDNVGDLQHVTQNAFQISRNPEDRPSFVDAVLDWLAHEWLDKNDRAFAWITAPYQNGTDNIIAEKEIGIPCPWIGAGSRLWHTTADTMEAVDRRALAHASMLGAAYSYFTATAGGREAALALALSERYGERRLAECATGQQERVLGAGRQRKQAQAEALKALRKERDASVARLETVLPIVGARQQVALKRKVAAAEKRVRQFAAGQEASLKALARS